MAIDNQPGHFIRLVRDQCVLQKGAQGKVSQRHLRCGALFIALGGDPSQRIPGTVRAGLGQQIAQIIEVIGDLADLSAQPHILTQY